MICGTIIMEDSVLHFRIPSDGGPEKAIELRVCDALTGEEHEVILTSRQFAASLALALDHEGMNGHPAQRALYQTLEEHPFGPNLGAIAELRGPVRWFP